MTDVRDIDIMRREIETIPDVLERQIRDQGPLVAELVRQLPGVRGSGQEPGRVVITGCGDSYFSGIATRLAFEAYAGVSAQPTEALEFARYEVRSPAGSQGKQIGRASCRERV
jgi:fructoselysine-6-P-deglycase FrlB-like protein